MAGLLNLNQGETPPPNAFAKAPTSGLNDDYVDPIFLTDKAKDLNDRFYLILNNLVNSYPDALINPSASVSRDNSNNNLAEYTSHMEDMKKLQSDYFLYKNEVLSSGETILKHLKETDDAINALDLENKKLQARVIELAGSSNSAEGMLDDTQLTRNQIFIGNIVLFAIIAAGGFIYYKKKTAV